MKKTIIAACMGLTLVQPAIAADFKPAVVYDKAGKFDKSFNEAVFRGAEKFKKDTGVEVKEVEPTNEAQVEQGLEKLARRGSSPIVAVGFSQANAVASVSAKYPDVQFTLIDMVVENPNVHSIVFKEHEGSFLVGALAAMKSATGKVGFIGGMDIPLIRKFGCGFEQGAKYENPKAEVFTNMIGSTGAAFNNPGKAAELAKSQFDSGADVIFAAAGSSGSGVYQAAKDVGKYAIGVDSNQNHLHPGTMLTSMVKRVDVAAYSNWMAAKDGKWEPGIEALGLAENGVDWALDEHNRALVTKEMEEKVNQIKADIISGKIKVHDYMSDNSCKY